MVALATAVAILDVFFILVAVPESLSEKVRVSPISWEQADPFSSLRNVGQDPTILLLCIAVFLSYLPEAGQYSCIFVYLKLVMGWSAPMVAVFVGLVGLLAVITQLCLGECEGVTFICSKKKKNTSSNSNSVLRKKAVFKIRSLSCIFLKYDLIRSFLLLKMNLKNGHKPVNSVFIFPF